MAIPSSAATLAPYALLVGLTPFLPVPFLDGIVARRLRRQLVRRLAEKHGRMLDKTTIALFTDPGDPTTFGEKMKGLGGRALLLSVKLLARKALIVFTIADVANLSAEAFVEGHLVDFALERDLLRTHSAAKIASAIARARYEEGTHPVALAAKRAVRDLAKAWPAIRTRIAQAFSTGPDAASTDAAVTSAGAAFAADLHEPRDYFDRLEAKFLLLLGA